MHRILSSLLIAAALSATGSALANDGPKPSPSQATSSTPAKPPDRADELFAQASTAYDAGRLAEALPKLEQAWALKKTHDIAGNLGVVEAKLGKYPQAAEHLTWALAHFPPSESEQTRKGYESQLEKARAESAVLRIRVSVDGAELSVNGRAVGKAPLADNVFVEPGAVKVAARRDGYLEAEQGMTVGKGDAREVSLTLLPAPNGGKKAEGRSIVPVMVLGGVSAAALVTGVGLTVVANNRTADVETLLGQGGGRSGCTGTPSGSLGKTCADLHSAVADHDHLSNAAVATFIVGGALALGTAGLGIWTWKSRSGAAVLATPVVGARHGELVITGAW